MRSAKSLDLSLNNRHSLLSAVRRWTYFIAPVLFLFFLFRRLDIDRLQEAFQRANKFYLLPVILLYPASILIGALRWNFLMNCFGNKPVSRSFALTQHWIGYTAGLLTPGYAGWDLYRLVSGGKATGAYRNGLLIILLERFTSLAAATAILLCAAGFLPIAARSETIWISRTAVFLLLASLGALGFLYWENGRLAVRISRFFKTRSWLDFLPSNPAASLRQALPLRRLMSLFGWSTGIQLLTVLNNWLFFHAVRPLTFPVVAFVSPAAVIVTLVPISFAGAGVREFTYLYLYRFFAVQAEEAVLVSFLNLGGILLNGIIGAGIWVFLAFRKCDTKK